MTHGIDCHVAETHELTVGCEDCETKRLGECDNATLVNTCGLTRRELEATFGTFPDGTAGPYAAFWDAVINANAMAVRARHRYVLRRAHGKT